MDPSGLEHTLSLVDYNLYKESMENSCIMSYKNIISQICQKNKLLFPEYESKPVSTENNVSVSWVSEIKFYHLKEVSAVKTKKIDSEQDAAKKLFIKFQELSKKLITKPTTPDLDIKYVVVVDIENIKPNIIIPENMHMWIFKSKYSNFKANLPNNVFTLEINSGIENAADHLIGYTLGKWISQKKYSPAAEFILLSNDKAMGIISLLLEEDNVNAIHFNKLEEYNKWFSNIC